MKKSFSTLEQSTQDLVAQLIREKQEHHKLLVQQTSHISAEQERTNQLAKEQHVQTRNDIIALLRDWWRGEHVTRKPQQHEEEELQRQQLEKERLIEDSILQSLRFPTMNDRYEDIEPARINLEVSCLPFNFTQLTKSSFRRTGKLSNGSSKNQKSTRNRGPVSLNGSLPKTESTGLMGKQLLENQL